jgi:hypothetical protein
MTVADQVKMSTYHIILLAFPDQIVRKRLGANGELFLNFDSRWRVCLLEEGL